MAVKDTTSLRPTYLSYTLFRDYHYTVYDSDGKPVLYLVTNKGSKRSYFVKDPINGYQSIVYENNPEAARYMLSCYTRDSTDLLDTLRHYKNEPGVYGMSVVDASGKRLYTFAFTLTD